MMRKKIIPLVFFLILILSSCTSAQSLLNESIDATALSQIQVSLAMGNPAYGAESKIMTDPNEISQLVEAFNGAIVGKRVDDDDLFVAGTSKYQFFTNQQIVHEFIFNGNDTLHIWFNGNWHLVDYPEQSPFELYAKSSANPFIVDENLQPMEIHE